MAPTDEAEKCPEPTCGSTDKGTRYQITPPTGNNPLGTFCQNAWHDVSPEVRRDEFAEQEFQIVFAVCVGWSNKDIAEHCGIAEDAVKITICSIFDKLGVSTRLELYLSVRDALSNDVRRRRGEPV